MAPAVATAERLKKVEDALGSNDLSRAITLSRAALDEGVEHPMLLNLRAYWHEKEGRLKESLFDLSRANALAPDDIAILNALGLIYARIGKLASAVTIFDGVIARQPKFWQAYYNRAWVCEEAGELIAAQQFFERANKLAPNAPDPLARLAALAGRRGDWNTARDYAERALQIDPTHDVAITAMAGAALARKDFAEVEKQLQPFLANEKYLPASKAAAWSTLGDMFDAQNRVSEAFEAYQIRNKLLRDLYAPQLTGPDVETVPQVLGWLTDAFREMSPSQFLPAGFHEESMKGGSAGHIFMMGFPRSGTTLLEEIFAGNPKVVTTQERDALGDGVRGLMARREDLHLLSTLRGASLIRQRKLYWKAIAGFGIDIQDKVLLDKQPYSTIKLPLISKLFPTAKILFCLRDPRDVVLSCFRRRFKMNPTNFEFLDWQGAARLYDATMTLAEIYRSKLPLDLIEVRHEALVENFDVEVRRICEFVGLSWDDAMRDFANRTNRRAITTPSATQVARGLNSEGIGTWRRYVQQMAPVLPILAPWIERFGYPKE